MNWGNTVTVEEVCAVPPEKPEFRGQLFPLGAGRHPGGTYYVPANPSDWTGTPPTTLEEAINRLGRSRRPDTVRIKQSFVPRRVADLQDGPALQNDVQDLKENGVPVELPPEVITESEA